MDERGLTRKGLAEYLGLAQKRITERLQILDLPDGLHPHIATGDVPTGAIRPLLTLAKVHPDLAALAVRRVTEPPPQRWMHQPSWSDLAAEPIAVVCSGDPDGPDELPDGVFENQRWYDVACFTLTDKAEKDLAALGELRDVSRDGFRFAFDADELDRAEALGACHRSSEDHCALVVGQDVADQLVSDAIGRQLKEARADGRDRRRVERQPGSENDAGSPDLGANDGTPADASPSEEELREQRRRERQAELETRRKAAAFNAELGGAVVKGFAKVKLDERVVKLLATLNVGGDLDQIAMRGARYGFPGWTQEVQQKHGAKTVYIDRREAAGAKAREFLSVAKSATEVAGRLVALVVMARYADEGAIAESAKSFYRMPIPRGLPWATELVDLIDELATERLPDHLTATKRQERAKQCEEQGERERLRAAIDEQLNRGTELSGEEVAALRDRITQTWSSWEPDCWQRLEQIRALEQALAEPRADESTDHDDTDAQPDDAAQNPDERERSTPIEP